MEADSTPTQKGNSGYSELAEGFAAGIAAQSRNADLVREYRRLHPSWGMRLLRRVLRRPQVANDERAASTPETPITSVHDPRAQAARHRAWSPSGGDLNRVSRGVPAEGQFATNQRPESDTQV